MALTAAQIVQNACAIAKAPGFTQFGGQCLNLTFDDLVLHRDLKINRVTTTITVQAGTYGPFDLEDDYLRTYDLFYPMPASVPFTGGIPVFLTPITTEQYDAELKDPSLANYPYEFATDLSPQAEHLPGQLFIYPQSSGEITLTHRYMLKRALIDTPETSDTVPWFPDQDYLIHATATRLMKITDDSRWATFEAAGNELLLKHLIMEGDEQQAVHNVKLDPRHFRAYKSLKLTKLSSF